MKKELFEELKASVREAGQIRRGERKASREVVYSPAVVRRLRNTFKAAQVAKARERLGLSQAEFAIVIGIPKATLQNWEQGRRKPEGPALALLRVALRKPAAVAEALGTVKIERKGKA